MRPAATPTVRTRRNGDCAVIEISNPPLNTSTASLRGGLFEAIDDMSRGGFSSAVLIGGGGTFVSGSDVHEFSGPIARPELPEVIEAIERSPIPFVAALDGYALGGGFELALACDARLGTPGLKVGLPEIEWGILPGAGGIQRLTRLVGKATALDIMLGAGLLDATTALQLGILSEVVGSADLESAAVAVSQRISKDSLVERDVPSSSLEEIGRIVERYRRSRADYPGLMDAVNLTLAVDQRLPAVGLEEERAAFNRLRVSQPAAAFRYIRFAEIRAPKSSSIAGVKAKPIVRIGVVGAGTMGAGIARLCAGSGLPTTITDIDSERAADVARGIDSLTSGSIEELAGCDLVIEAVVEEMAVKRELFARLEAVVAPDAVLASNTSYLDLNEMAQLLGDPSRFVGLHFFNPAERMKLLEVIRGARTSDRVLASVLSLARTLGKTAIIAGVTDGFVANRMFAAYRRECEVLLQDGAYVDQIDQAIKEFGFRMGPFEVADLSGLDIAWSRRKRLADSRSAQERYVDIPDRLCEAGRLGRKTGAGYYRYDSGTGRPTVDDQVTSLILESSSQAGVVRRTFTDGEIVGRAVAALTNEAAHILSDGVAAKPGDIDVAAVLGYGFPRHRGGPLWYSANLGLNEHVRNLDALMESAGSEVTPVGDIGGLFEEVLASSR